MLCLLGAASIRMLRIMRFRLSLNPGLCLGPISRPYMCVLSYESRHRRASPENECLSVNVWADLRGNGRWRGW